MLILLTVILTWNRNLVMKLAQAIDINMDKVFGKYIEEFWGMGPNLGSVKFNNVQKLSKTKFDEVIVFYCFEGVHRDRDNQK